MVIAGNAAKQASQPQRSGGVADRVIYRTVPFTLGTFALAAREGGSDSFYRVTGGFDIAVGCAGLVAPLTLVTGLRLCGTGDLAFVGQRPSASSDVTAPASRGSADVQQCCCRNRRRTQVVVF